MAVSEVDIWHNPRCSKSRAALALIEAHGLTPRPRLYLTDPPDADALRAMLAALGLPAAALLRPEGKALADQPEDRIIAALAADPRLIERPLLRWGNRAVIARPPENALPLLQQAQSG